MSEVNPVHRETTVTKTVSEVRDIITSRLQFLKGKIVMSDDMSMECDFGSLLKSRLLGEFWVSKSTLPKKAMINLKDAESGHTLITLDMRDTHKYGVKWGYVKKYEKALEELADSILSSFQ
jgi:hypothetical protein